jgi:Flp pilus assembly protein TadG
MRFLNFLGDRKASIAPLVALSAIPIMAAVGAGVDYSRANLARTAMQSALDATALMLAKDVEQSSGGPVTQNAAAYFNANFTRSDVENIQVSAAASSGSGGTSLSLSATGSIDTVYLGLVAISTVNLSVASGAWAASTGLGCVLSLDPTASAAVSAQGSTTVNLTGCNLYDNSNSPTALSAGGSASVAALSVGVVGGVSGTSNIVTQQGIFTGLGTIADPYANVAIPSFSGCSQTNFTAKSTVTVDPGVYCNGMKLNAGANVTLNPGIYYLDGGSLSVDGGATLTGTAVTLVFTKQNMGTWATATINGNATVNLTAPNYGPTSGIAVFADRGTPVGTIFKFNGGSTQYFGGAVYVPTGAINFSGGNGTSASCTQIIGDTVTFTGNSAVAINCSSYGTRPISATLIKLTS